jgi:phosphatidylglycerophosphatase C
VNLALFDFDGTITHTDSFTKFVLYAADKRRIRRGKLLLLPEIIAYKTRLTGGKRIRHKIFNLAFKNTVENEIKMKALEFSENVIPSLIRPQAMERINWHKDRGDEIRVVSASLDLYLEPWCKKHNIALSCNEVEAVSGIVTGNFIGHDCSADEKRRRVENAYDLSHYTNIYAYGDTFEDRELLKLANHPFYRHF